MTLLTPNFDSDFRLKALGSLTLPAALRPRPRPHRWPLSASARVLSSARTWVRDTAGEIGKKPGQVEPLERHVEGVERSRRLDPAVGRSVGIGVQRFGRALEEPGGRDAERLAHSLPLEAHIRLAPRSYF